MGKKSSEASREELIEAIKQRSGLTSKLRALEQASRAQLAAEYKFLSEIGSYELGFAAPSRLLQLIRRRELAPDAWHTANELVEDLIETVVAARKGNKHARNQMTAARKILRGDVYGIERSKIAALAATSVSVQMARGLTVRQYMLELSLAVEPADAKERDVWRGRVRLSEDSLPDSWAYKTAKKYLGQSTAKATLKTLAIKAYLDDLHDQGFTNVTYDSLDRDYLKAARWLKQFKTVDMQTGELRDLDPGKHHRWLYGPFAERESREECRGGKRGRDSKRGSKKR